MDHNCNVEERIDPNDQVVYFVAVCPDCDYDGEPKNKEDEAEKWGDNHCNLMNFGMNLETGETYTSAQPSGNDG